MFSGGRPEVLFGVSEPLGWLRARTGVHPRSMISLVSYHPPAAVDALVAEIFGDCLATDLADGYAG
jgi:hypothetical protein